MTQEQINQYLDSTKVYDLHLYPSEMSDDTNNGWKLSIQGKTKDDSLFLWNSLHTILDKMDIPYKMGTAKRLGLIKSGDNKKREQGHKVMTIYIPNIYSKSMDDVYTFAEHIYSYIKQYKGWYDVKNPTSYEHYAGGIFIRNDRNVNGEYVSAN